ncbi:hypothetical protein GLYMA_19G079900v4 [Glycine max]|uniref:Uncharacterized protein n=1 Tax=Glycine max TaxID=3847 RepID=K7MX70_SOYBN|nr:hypothetical protein GYH30_052392 [Glycine max]KRG94372.1 hypothetical protein GLYMA_19G079900v4 [Glycine max]
MVQKREVMAKKVAFGFLFSEVVPCLILFLVIAADKTHGWSGDSFDRYKEYRFKVESNDGSAIVVTPGESMTEALKTNCEMCLILIAIIPMTHEFYS